MKEQTLKNLSPGAIPDPLAPDNIKKSNQYGLNVAMAIAQEWFSGGFLNDKNTLFTRRHEWIREMRVYNRGEQGIEQYQKILARQDEDKDILNLDMEITNYAEKFTNIVKNGISEDFYRLDIRSADRFSMLQREKNYKRHKMNMNSKDMLEKAKEILGIDMVPKGFVPEDDEELKLYSEIAERPMQEIAEEIMINYVKELSGWDYIKDKADGDIVVADLMASRIKTDPVNGVIIEPIDIEAYGHSYVERNDFKDAYYHFVVDTITINDLKRESNFQESDLRQIAKSYSSFNNHTGIDYDRCPIEDIINYRVNVMRFCFKSDKEIVMKAYLDKKNRTQKVAMRDSDYQVPEGAEKSRLSKVMDTWYEGNYIVGSNKYIYGYQECENIERDELNRAQCSFIVQSTNIYKNKLKSFLSNIIPMLNKLILADFKIQHLMMELKPDIVVINLDQLAEIEPLAKGESKKKNVKTAMSILNVKGIVLEKTIDLGDEGGVQKGQSARPSPNSQGSALGPLLNIWGHYYNIIREVTGINPARDGSISPDTLVGVNQMMQLASNTATKHIVDGAVAWDKRICEAVSSRLKTIFSHEEAEHLQEMYIKAVGKHNVDALKSLKNRSVYDFGFSIEMVPAKEELDELKQDLAIAIQEGSLDVSEKSEIMRVARYNIKQAIEYMKFVRRRRIKERMKETEFNNKVQAQNNIAAAQAKTESEVNVYGAQKKFDLQYEGQLAQIRLMEKQAAQQIEAPVKDKEFRQELYKEQIKNAQTLNLTKYKEDAKADRELKNSTRQSKMVEQRQRDMEAIDFERENLLQSIFD